MILIDSLGLCVSTPNSIIAVAVRRSFVYDKRKSVAKRGTALSPMRIVRREE